MMEKPKSRMDALSKLVAIGDDKGFCKITDFPNSYTSEMLEWHRRFKEQTERAVEALKEIDLPMAQIEDTNLLNYLELLLGKEPTSFMSRTRSVTTSQLTGEGKQ